MEEPKKKDEVKPVEPAPTENSNTMIDRANAAAQRMEDANTQLTQLLAKQESMKVEQTLGGETEAGQPSKTEDEINIEAAKTLLDGTGFEDILDAPPKEPAKFTKS